jgi:hypothetical protein
MEALATRYEPMRYTLTILPKSTLLRQVCREAFLVVQLALLFRQPAGSSTTMATERLKTSGQCVIAGFLCERDLKCCWPRQVFRSTLGWTQKSYEA